MSHYYVSRSDQAKWENCANGLVVWVGDAHGHGYNKYREFATNFFSRSSSEDKQKHRWGGYWNRHNVTPSVAMMADNIQSYIDGPFKSIAAQEDAVHYKKLQTFLDHEEMWVLFDYLLAQPWKGTQSIDISVFVHHPDLVTHLQEALHSYEALGEPCPDPRTFLASFAPMVHAETPLHW